MSTHDAAGSPRRPPHLDTLSGTIELDLPEFVAPPADPGPLLEQWVATAVEVGVIEPFSVALATVDAAGRPANRTVLLKRLSASGIEFVTTTTSAKGRQLAANPVAAVTAYWRETRQQLRLVGAVERLSDAECDALFAGRPRVSQASASVSRQSEPLDNYGRLRAAVDVLAATADPIPRPPAWGAYRLVPDEIEFWHGSVDRLHRRIRYTRNADGWEHVLLNP